jgi:hypothetical protein
MASEFLSSHHKLQTKPGLPLTFLLQFPASGARVLDLGSLLIAADYRFFINFPAAGHQTLNPRPWIQDMKPDILDTIFSFISKGKNPNER